MKQGSSDDSDSSTLDTGLLSLDALEERHVEKILKHTRWHKGRTCEILGISRPALERKIIRYGLDKE